MSSHYTQGHAQMQQLRDEIVAGIQSGALLVEDIEVRWDKNVQTYILQIVDPARTAFLSKFSSSTIQALPNRSWPPTAVSIETIPSPSPAIEDLGNEKEPIIGFRDFYLGTGMYPMPGLISRNKSPWPMREPMRAFCRAGALSPHDAPAVDCECGIYAFSKSDHTALLAGAVIWGEIAMWGDVLICPEGYRSEFAYPKTLFIKDTDTKAVRWLRDHLADSYGVPVFLLERKEGKSTSDVISELLASEGLT